MMKKDEHFNHTVIDLVDPINRYIHVPVSHWLVKALLPTPITPNQVTVLGTLFGVGAAYAFSRGTLSAMMVGGILFELCLLMDCVDGQLARAKNMSSEMGRIIDGIGDYVARLSIVFGLWWAYPNSAEALLVLTVMTLLRAVTYDYYKEIMTSRLQNGYDGSLEDMRKTCRRIEESSSWVDRIYFYYLQFQQLLFQGRWSTLKAFSSARDLQNPVVPASKGERNRYYQKHKPLMVLWKWNSPDLVYFMIVVFALAGSLEFMLPIIAYFVAAQTLLTFILHHYFLRNETAS